MFSVCGWGELLGIGLGSRAQAGHTEAPSKEVQEAAERKTSTVDLQPANRFPQRHGF